VVGCSAWFTVPQPTEWQGIGDQIDTAIIFWHANLVNIWIHSSVAQGQSIRPQRYDLCGMLVGGIGAAPERHVDHPRATDAREPSLTPAPASSPRRFVRR
jgi:hypothetical protein